ncbi:MAG: hypothetical protein K5985_09540 [Lachnospiraceae bacterium]|nr:hypothetical protein [Lachnospiraceae bacterium]
MDTITHSLILPPSPEESLRFDRVLNRILSSAHKRGSIGTLSEKTTHLVLKHFLEEDTRFHEVKVGDFVADIFDGERIIEIQSRSFGNLKRKLAVFLDVAPVTVIYPVSVNNTIFWISPVTGEFKEQRKSGKHGRAEDIFGELVFIKEFLNHPGLSFRLMFLETGDYRLLDGYGPDNKKHSTRYDQVPKVWLGDCAIKSLSDYVNLIPGDLSPEFTAKDFGRAAKLPSRLSSRAVNVLSHVGAIRRIGKKGRSFLYTKK